MQFKAFAELWMEAFCQSTQYEITDERLFSYHSVSLTNKMSVLWITYIWSQFQVH